MKSLIKNEIKVTKKYRLTLTLLMVFAQIGVLYFGYMTFKQGIDYITVGEFIVSFISIWAFGIVPLLMFINMANTFKKELYEDTGYLVFTLPVKGTEIVMSKIITSILWIFFTGILMLLGGILVSGLFGYGSFFMESFFEEQYGLIEIIISILAMIIFLTFILVITYFSIAFTRYKMKNRRYGKLWIGTAFIIFIILSFFSVNLEDNGLALAIFLLFVSVLGIYATGHIIENEIDI